MPFRSEAQRRYLYAKHPQIAKRFAEEYGTKIQPSRMGKGQFASGKAHHRRAESASVRQDTLPKKGKR